MFKNKTRKPTQVKYVVYMTGSVLLGLILSFVAHAWIEMAYLNWAAARGVIVPFYGNCALSPFLQVGLWMAGVFGGYFLGKWWWSKVYIEQVWWNKGWWKGR